MNNGTVAVSIAARDARCNHRDSAARKAAGCECKSLATGNQAFGQLLCVERV